MPLFDYPALDPARKMALVSELADAFYGKTAKLCWTCREVVPAHRLEVVVDAHTNSLIQNWRYAYVCSVCVGHFDLVEKLHHHPDYGIVVGLGENELMDTWVRRISDEED